MVAMSDASAASQLAGGFYGLEEKRWRWAAREFAVMLEPPRNADETGAELQLQLFIPDKQIQDLGPMTLNADVDGYALEPRTLASGGGNTQTWEVPAAALRSSLVRVNFSFDKAMPPTSADARELAAVVTRAGLIVK